jgi:hypothetical protein
MGSFEFFYFGLCFALLLGLSLFVHFYWPCGFACSR